RAVPPALGAATTVRQAEALHPLARRARRVADRIGAQRAVVPVLKAGGAGGEVGRTASVAAAGQRDAGQRRLAAALIRAGTVRRMAVRAGRAAGLAALTKRRARGVRLADLRSTVTAGAGRPLGSGRTSRAGRTRGARAPL